MDILTMALLTVALRTMALLTMALRTRAVLAMALRTMARRASRSVEMLAATACQLGRVWPG